MKELDDSLTETIKLEKIIIQNRIMKRIRKIEKALLKLNLRSFYIAGSSLREEEPNDYDLFPTSYHYSDFETYFSFPKTTPGYVWDTGNAITLELDGNKIQLCKFKSKTLEDLVERFDFTHVKLGAKVTRVAIGKTYTHHLSRIYVSPDYINSRILNRSHYTGLHEGDYPLSSLIRTYKYYERGAIKNIYDVLFHIIETFLERGFRSEEDFYDQLKAIDLDREAAQGIEENRKRLIHIYYLLTGETINVLDINRISVRSENENE